ncbi:MAG: hypothetical protein CM1200mP20_07620 [Pseudomonadota bacterium]|nr:MAG: hypothetical protein CM1200mP20_07620 [Pseudomonadota bacterium]
MKVWTASFDPAGYGTVVVNIDYNYRGECFLGEKLTILTGRSNSDAPVLF